MTNRITIKDIAAKLGISHATVSRALSGHPNVNSETRARVQAAAGALGYIPNSSARILRAGTSTLIGLIVPDVQNEVHAIFAKSIGECCAAHGYQMVLSNTEEDPDLELNNIRALAEVRCAGAVVMLTNKPRRETLKLLKEFPIVQILRRHGILNSDWIGIDDRAAMALAANHLIELGHTRIGYIGGLIDVNTGIDRLAGYREALEQHGLPFDEAIVMTGSVRARFACDAVNQLLRKEPRPTAIITAGARVMLGVMEGIEMLGLGVPADVSVVGYTDPPWLRGWGPGVTAVTAPFREIGLAAGQLLMQRMAERRTERRHPLSPVSSMFAPSIVVRGSTTAAPDRTALTASSDGLMAMDGS